MPTATNGRLGRFPVNAAPSAGGLKRNALKRETRLEKPNAIGELNERSLHRALKARYATPGSVTEQAVDGFVADVLIGDRIVEVHTGSFWPLIPAGGEGLNVMRGRSSPGPGDAASSPVRTQARNDGYRPLHGRT